MTFHIWIIGPNISAEKRLHAIVELELLKFLANWFCAVLVITQIRCTIYLKYDSASNSPLRTTGDDCFVPGQLLCLCNEIQDVCWLFSVQS